MHKKYILILFVAVILLPCIVCADVTEKRGLVEFVELYTQRMDEYQQETGAEFSMLPGYYVPPFQAEDLLYVESLAGSIGIHPEDLAIHDVLMTFVVTSDDQAASKQAYVSCAAALSALEYDTSQDKGFHVLNSSALQESLDIVRKIYGDIGEALVDVQATGSRVLVYSGNYDYYLDLQEKDTAKIIYLIAEEHK